MIIKIVQYKASRSYFEMHVQGRVAYTSKGISKLLNLDLDLYNKLLVEKVIKHNHYVKSKYHNDFEFDLCNTPEEIYIERFKETFINQLTLLTLGGESNEN